MRHYDFIPVNNCYWIYERDRGRGLWMHRYIYLIPLNLYYIIQMMEGWTKSSCPGQAAGNHWKARPKFIRITKPLARFLRSLGCGIIVRRYDGPPLSSAAVKTLVRAFSATILYKIYILSILPVAIETALGGLRAVITAITHKGTQTMNTPGQNIFPKTVHSSFIPLNPH